ncbi:MAG: ribosome-associated translation inhibitor RaiA [Desulfobacterota bacterium]|nr:ribosome-associated translation inhibitor RaiA [Thermodesulfobacteriota bacterium]
MDIIVTFRHIQPNDALRSYAEEKASRIGKYVNNVREIHVILTLEKRSYVAEVIVHVNRAKITAKEATEDNMYASIDLVMDKIERQIKKYKDKMTDHKEHSRKALHNVFAVTETGNKSERTVVRTETVSIATMTVDNALRHLGEQEEDFFVFKNQDTDQVNVLYRRRDGGIGLIEPARS